MIQELTIAGNLLNSALDRYINACLAIRKHYLKEGSFAAVAPELSSRVNSEAELVVTLNLKIHQAKSAIFWARNCSPSLVPIHSLPRELLARIFLFVSRSQHNHTRYSGLSMRNRPEVVSHVCSRWRELAVNSPSFWSTICLSVVGSPAKIVRATAFAERARSLPLELQLHDQDLSTSSVLTDLSGIISTISPRIRSLQLVIQDDLQFHHSFLEYLAAACQHGAGWIL
ncbi:F-box-like protein [Rhizoctonia solani 123E]|uniref:F-box-like protein n=1 Tax=Rhizoctonia solani 123E TaxID=1423351 RepID=A0A074SLS1_9AGAM|nr:F-box-like protein [Rhizoctonia solani 123E]